VSALGCGHTALAADRAPEQQPLHLAAAFTLLTENTKGTVRTQSHFIDASPFYLAPKAINLVLMGLEMRVKKAACCQQKKPFVNLNCAWKIMLFFYICCL
jgi:hypothetical protein